MKTPPPPPPPALVYTRVRPHAASPHGFSCVATGAYSLRRPPATALTASLSHSSMLPPGEGAQDGDSM